jgi:hypothetical protein
VLSRRILPGFFMAVNMMIGADAVEECRRTAKDIFDRVRPGGLGQAGWTPFLSDCRAQQLLADSLVSMGRHFANPDKRAACSSMWTTNHLSPPLGEPASATTAALPAGLRADERRPDFRPKTAVGSARTRER